MTLVIEDRDRQQDRIALSAEFRHRILGTSNKQAFEVEVPGAGYQRVVVNLLARVPGSPGRYELALTAVDGSGTRANVATRPLVVAPAP